MAEEAPDPAFFGLTRVAISAIALTQIHEPSSLPRSRHSPSRYERFCFHHTLGSSLPGTRNSSGRRSTTRIVSEILAGDTLDPFALRAPAFSRLNRSSWPVRLLRSERRPQQHSFDRRSRHRHPPEPRRCTAECRRRRLVRLFRSANHHGRRRHHDGLRTPVRRRSARTAYRAWLGDRCDRSPRDRPSRIEPTHARLIAAPSRRRDVNRSERSSAAGIECAYESVSILSIGISACLASSAGTVTQGPSFIRQS